MHDDSAKEAKNGGKEQHINDGINAMQSGLSHESLGWLPIVGEPVKPGEHEQWFKDSCNGEPSTKSRTASPSPSSWNRAASVYETPSSTKDADGTNDYSEAGYVKQAASVAHTVSLSRRSIFTNIDGQPISGSAFIHGAGTTGPHSTAVRNDELSLRAASADTALTPGQKSRINKHEEKEAWRLSKIVKEEGKVEKKALSVAIKELAELQGLQKAAVKEQEEAKAHSAHAKMLGNLRKCEVDYLEAKAKYEAILARLSADAQALIRIRENAREATVQMQAKSQEVDGLRMMYSVDEREREVKLMQLTTGKKSRSFFRG
ncbi:hypothetical protein AX15_004128 [Amanita polypyramis BW_CC]|nr:hypothetical protein AX15_004128 [Amanita polypyramis BW_CC]